MNLVLNEIVHLVRECEEKETLREVERIRNERKCYEDIKAVLEPYLMKEVECSVKV